MPGTKAKMMLSKFLQMVLLLEIWRKSGLFKEEPRNLKISLATDGVNPFAQMKSIYTVWPIFVINDNNPPWMSILEEAHNVVDVYSRYFVSKTVLFLMYYIEPLINELLQLWSPISLYDVSRPI